MKTRTLLVSCFFSLLLCPTFLLRAQTTVTTTCTPFPGYSSDFQTISPNGSNCGVSPFTGVADAAVNRLCLEGWTSSHGSPDLREYIPNANDPALGIAVEPISSSENNRFLTPRVDFNENDCRSEAVVLTGNFDPNKLYKLTFRHRTATYDNVLQPLNLQIWTSRDQFNLPMELSTGQCPDFILPAGSNLIWDANSFRSTVWVDVPTISFRVDPGQNQIVFYCEQAVSSLQEGYWAIDDVVILECDPCEASFDQVNNTFINTSLPLPFDASDECCVGGFSSVRWRIYEVYNNGSASSYSVNALNFTYSPTSGDVIEYEVCLEIEDCCGCKAETCSGLIDTRRTAGGRKRMGASGEDRPLETEQLPALKVMPNPSSSTFYIELEAEMLEGDYELYLTNLAGQRVHTVTDRSSRPSIDSSRLPAGTYLLIYEGGNQVVQQKVVVQHF